MDGPQAGPTDAFARLAALNPLNTAALAERKAALSAGERAFVLLRPAVVKGALVSEICLRFKTAGLTLVAMKMMKPGADLAKKHYTRPSRKTSELAELVGDLSPGPAVAMVWHGTGAIATLLAMAGDADPLKALPGSVRGDLSVADCPDQLIEVAADAAEVSRLADVWFEPDELR